MLDPTYPLFPILSFLGFVLALLPLPWHLQAWNAGTCCYMIWSSLACLLKFVNSVAWKDNAINFAPVWCDISSKLLLGAGIGIPASSLCISRRLYNIAAVQATSSSRQDKRRALIGDLCIAVGLPVVVMVLHYVVQGHRFDIIEQVGCIATIYNTLASYFLVFLWPVFIGCISCVYSGLTLRAFYKRRIQFAQLVSSNSSMSMNRYLKLVVLASTEIICTVPISAYSMYISNVGLGLSPYISWSNVHFGFSYVGQIPAVEWRSNRPTLISIELSRWIFPACALLFFALFGLGADARRHYISAFWMISKRFGVTSAPTKTSLPLSSRYVSPNTPIHPLYAHIILDGNLLPNSIPSPLLWAR
ncbi:STE3-like pheromone receptor [Athelia psychrophila]|uniref:STE3-like pheromone receptor n=1 Tax=Athelia psychrophila TaxID=1759441 RepID=A0A166CSS6_9AGAM|nr:STE3-like pheromone receptor [Fibularhizoctonia sp. CBS 109695]